MNRLSPIFETRSPTAVAAEITRLQAAFKSATKRALPASLLSISSWGEPRKPIYGISLYWDDAEAADAKWVREHVAKTPATQSPQ